MKSHTPIPSVWKLLWSPTYQHPVIPHTHLACSLLLGQMALLLVSTEELLKSTLLCSSKFLLVHWSANMPVFWFKRSLPGRRWWLIHWVILFLRVQLAMQCASSTASINMGHLYGPSDVWAGPGLDLWSLPSCLWPTLPHLKKIARLIFQTWFSLVWGVFLAENGKSDAMNWMFVSCVEILSPNGGIRRWGLWEIIRSWEWSTHEWVECPYKRNSESSLTLFLPCEDTRSS